MTNHSSSDKEQPEQKNESLSQSSSSPTPPSAFSQVFEQIQAKQPSYKPTPLAEKQEETRGVLAKNLIDILRLVVTFLLVLVVVDRIAATTFAFHGKKYEYSNTESKDIATLILTSLSGLVGTALGFYFGSRSSVLDGNKRDE